MENRNPSVVRGGFKNISKLCSQCTRYPRLELDDKGLCSKCWEPGALAKRVLEIQGVRVVDKDKNRLDMSDMKIGEKTTSLNGHQFRPPPVLPNK